jgi:hypothetical protein
VCLRPFYIPALDGSQKLASSPELFTPGKNPGIHWIDLKACLDVIQERTILPIQGFATRILQSLAWSLYQVHYSGFLISSTRLLQCKLTAYQFQKRTGYLSRGNSSLNFRRFVRNKYTTWVKYRYRYISKNHLHTIYMIE